MRGNRQDTAARTLPISASSCRAIIDDLSTKPKIQKQAREAYDKHAPLNGVQAREDYVNFYAYLHTVVDKRIMTVLDTLEETGLTNDTLILRFADHGEGGLSHGMREKAYTAYEE